MELYSKYRDSKGRTLVVINRWAAITVTDKTVNLKPNTVVLLDVEGEKVHELDNDLVQSWIDQKAITRIVK